MSGFYSRILNILARPASGLGPAVPSALFPPDDPPAVLVCVGPAEPRDAAGLRRQLPSDAVLLLIHPPCDPARRAELERAAPPETRTLFAALDPADAFADKVGMLVAGVPDKRVRLVVAHGFGERYAAEIQAIQEAITTALDNAQQDRNRGLIRLKASIRNLPLIARDAGLRIGRVPPGTDAIICGAGPSLAGQFDELRRARGRAVLIAVGHAAPALARAGLVPDAVVEVDAHAARNWPEEVRPPALLAACTEVSPEVAARFPRILWWAGSSPAFNLALKILGLNLPETQMAKSVTVPAIDLAVRLGCARIALVGQEFCLAPDGRSHVDGEALAGGDETLELPGNDGPPVLATRNFASLRDALQKFLRGLNAYFAAAAARPQVFNCTAGGAVLDGAVRMSLADFCAGLPAGPVAFELAAPGPAPAVSWARLDETDRLFREYGVIAENIIEACGNLLRELQAPDMSITRVRLPQRVLQQLVANEDRLRQAEWLAAWVNPLIQHADQVMKETPGLVSQAADPQAQLIFLSTRFRYLADLCAEFAGEWRAAAARIRDPAAAPPAGGPLEFASFRHHGIRWVRAGNPDYAQWLESNPAAAPGARLVVRWLNQYLPFAQWVGADGRVEPLSGFVSMFDQAKTEIDRFVDRVGLDPRRHGVICAGPGNWVYVLELSARYPNLEMIVADPWPELFAALIAHGVFLHRLPPRTLVLGVDDRLPGWREGLRTRLAAWRGAGLQPLVLAHPAAGRVPELAEFAQRIMEWAGA